MPVESLEDHVSTPVVPTQPGKRKGWTTESARAALAIRYAKAKSNQDQPLPLSEPTQALDSQAQHSRRDWAKIELQARKSIKAAQSSGDQKQLLTLATVAGIAFDKAFKGITDESPKLVTPEIVVRNLLLLTERMHKVKAGDTVVPIVVNPTTLDTATGSVPCEPIPLSES